MKKNRNILNKVKVSGGNSISFINNCVSSGVKLNNINRTNIREITFDVTDKEYKKLSGIDNRGCNVSLLKIGGKKKLYDILIYRMGLVIGIIISLICLIIMDNRLIQIHVLGLTKTREELVIESLHNLGITRFSYMNYDIKKLELDLAKEFDFSLVSIVIKGNSMIINIKEELLDLESSYAPITADYNMIVKSIKVYAGTSLVKEGDIVYKGDVLVEPYIKKGNDIVYVTPTAELTVSVFYSNSYVFKNNEVIFVRTGRKELIKSKVIFGTFNISNKDKTTSFVSYEQEEDNIDVSLYYLPISIIKTYAYELEKNSITRDFEKEKDEIIDNQKKILYDSVPKNLKIESEDVKITAIDKGYIINIHLMSNLVLKYT